MEKVLGMIGLAKRARMVSVGAFVCEASIKNADAKLVIIAEDASENSVKSIKNSCIYYKVPFVIFSDKQSLGKITGGGEKAVVSVNDRNFAEAIMKKITAVQRKER